MLLRVRHPGLCVCHAHRWVTMRAGGSRKPASAAFSMNSCDVGVHRLDAGGRQFVARAGTDLGHQHGVAVVDGAHDGGQLFVFAVAALAVLRSTRR
jgi:hypothetical protein